MSAPEDVQRLAGERADARAAKDFALADELRDRIHELGWEVTDQPGGFALQPVSTEADGPVRAADVPSLLSGHLRRERPLGLRGWLDDIDRALAASATAEGRRVQFVVADVTGEAPKYWADADDVEVVWLEPDTGWPRARGSAVRSLDRGRSTVRSSPPATSSARSTRPGGPDLGVCTFGITQDLREFRRRPTPGRVTPSRAT